MVKSSGTSSSKPQEDASAMLSDFSKACALGIGMGSMESVSSGRSGSQATMASSSGYSTTSSRGSSSRIAHDAQTVRLSSPRHSQTYKTTTTRSASGRVWNSEQDEVLRAGVLRLGSDSWKGVAEHVVSCGDYSAEDCRIRWGEVKDQAVKGPWSPDEDALLSDLVAKFGPKPKKWSFIASHIPGRAGKQCRERWLNHLDTTVKKGEWTEEEDRILCDAQREIGNKWSEIAKLLTGRAENSVKNRFNSLITRRLSRGGKGANGMSDPSSPTSAAELLMLPASLDGSSTSGASGSAPAPGSSKPTTSKSKTSSAQKPAKPKKAAQPRASNKTTTTNKSANNTTSTHTNNTSNTSNNSNSNSNKSAVDVKNDPLELVCQDQLLSDADIDTLLDSLSSSAAGGLHFLPDSYSGGLDSTSSLSQSSSSLTLPPMPLPSLPLLATMPLPPPFSFLAGGHPPPLPPPIPRSITTTTSTSLTAGAGPAAATNPFMTSSTSMPLFMQHGLLCPPPPVPISYTTPTPAFSTGFGHTPSIIRQPASRQTHAGNATHHNKSGGEAAKNKKAPQPKIDIAYILQQQQQSPQQPHSYKMTATMTGSSSGGSGLTSSSSATSMMTMMAPDSLGLLTPRPPATGAGELMPQGGEGESAINSGVAISSSINGGEQMGGGGGGGGGGVDMFRSPFYNLSMGSEEWSMMDPLISDDDDPMGVLAGGLGGSGCHDSSLLYASMDDSSSSSRSGMSALLRDTFADLGLVENMAMPSNMYTTPQQHHHHNHFTHLHQQPPQPQQQQHNKTMFSHFEAALAGSSSSSSGTGGNGGGGSDMLISSKRSHGTMVAGPMRPSLEFDIGSGSSSISSMTSSRGNAPMVVLETMEEDGSGESPTKRVK